MERRERQPWDHDQPAATMGGRAAAVVDEKDRDLDEVNPVLLSAMIAAIKERPEAQSVNDADRIKICTLAIQQGTIGDAAWLNRQLLAASRSEAGLDESSPYAEPEELHPFAPSSEESDDEVTAAAPPTEDIVKKVIAQIFVPAINMVTSREELDPLLEQHRAWIEATLNPKMVLAPQGRANLTGSAMQGFDLHDVDLRGATLQGVNLSGANLEGANLATANLAGANLTSANLTAANLKRCLLTETDLRGANLRGTCLRLEDLRGAIYDEAQIAEARLVP